MTMIQLYQDRGKRKKFLIKMMGNMLIMKNWNKKSGCSRFFYIKYGLFFCEFNLFCQGIGKNEVVQVFIISR